MSRSSVAIFWVVTAMMVVMVFSYADRYFSCCPHVSGSTSAPPWNCARLTGSAIQLLE